MNHDSPSPRSHRPQRSRGAGQRRHTHAVAARPAAHPTPKGGRPTLADLAIDLALLGGMILAGTIVVLLVEP
jgi:hypothetical protein